MQFSHHSDHENPYACIHTTQEVGLSNARHIRIDQRGKTMTTPSPPFFFLFGLTSGSLHSYSPLAALDMKAAHLHVQWGRPVPPWQHYYMHHGITCA